MDPRTKHLLIRLEFVFGCLNREPYEKGFFSVIFNHGQSYLFTIIDPV